MLGLACAALLVGVTAAPGGTRCHCPRSGSSCQHSKRRCSRIPCIFSMGITEHFFCISDSFGFDRLTRCSVSHSSHILVTFATSEVFASGPPLVSVHIWYEIQELWLMFVPTLDMSAAESRSSALGVRLVASVCLTGYSRTSPVLFSQFYI